MITTMSGVDFLNDWISKNVTPDDVGEARATILSTQRILEAATRGIMVADKEDGGPIVERVILDAMRHLAEPGWTAD